MRRAYLVLGTESSGTRLLSRILVAAGCEGSFDHYQWWDDHEFTDQELVVWRRSFPHAGVWPNLAEVVGRLQGAGFDEVTALVVVRDHWATACSQTINRPVMNVRAAEAHMEEAYARIFSGLATLDLPFYVLTYENLVARPRKMQRWLKMELDLPSMPDIEVHDGNVKHWEGLEWLR